MWQVPISPLVANLATLLAAPLKFGVWIALAGGGMYFGWRHDATPGVAAKATDWPAGATFARDERRPTIVMFVHPACPCTKASLSELRTVLLQKPDSAKFVAVIVGADGLEREMSSGPNVALARSIEGSVLIFDQEARETARFGAATSGQTYAFSSDGALLFRGGLTSSRGHLGPSQGLESLENILINGRVTWNKTPVYGCALWSGGSR